MTFDWKGTILEYDGLKFYSRSDKTKIFDALRLAHDSYMYYLSNCVGQLHLIRRKKRFWEGIMSGCYTDKKDMDKLVEYFDIKKIAEDVKDNQY